MLWVRTLLSLLIVAVIAGVLWLDHHFQSDLGFTLLLALTLALATRELVDLMFRAGHTPYGTLAVVAGPMLVVARWLDIHRTCPLPVSLLTVVALTLLAALIALATFFVPRRAAVVSVSLTVFPVLYVWGLGSFIQHTRYVPQAGMAGVLLLLTSVKSADIGGYLSGRFLGRIHPFKRVSPNKSVEGYAGSLALAFIVCLFLGSRMFPGYSWVYWLGFALVGWFFGGLGDLFESALKRDLGAKDSATRFPGLGGILDLLDSLLLASPALFILFRAMGD